MQEYYDKVENSNTFDDPFYGIIATVTVQSELNASGKCRNAYQYISDQISKKNGGYVFVDTGFTSGIPDWLNHPIILEHNSSYHDPTPKNEANAQMGHDMMNILYFVTNKRSPTNRFNSIDDDGI